MCRVLIIEDEWLIAEQLVELATQAGATLVETAATEARAVEVAHELVPDIILSDVHLKAGTGPAAVQAITAELGPIPVVFITATPEACKGCDPSHVVLTKPVQAQRVVETLKKIVSA